MEAIAVACVVARGCVDALEVLLSSQPVRRRCAGSRAVNAVWVGAGKLGGGRPMLRAARDATSARPGVRCYSPRIPHDKVTKWQSISIRPCQGVIIG